MRKETEKEKLAEVTKSGSNEENKDDEKVKEVGKENIVEPFLIEGFKKGDVSIFW